MFEIGFDVKTKEPFSINTVEFLKSHTFIQAITGGGKTSLNLSFIEFTESNFFKSKFGHIQKIILDDCGEYLNIPKYYKNFEIFQNQGKYSGIFDVEHAFEVGRKTRQLDSSMILKLSDFKTQKERESFVAKFLEGFRIPDREYWKPALLIIDEADLYVPSSNKRGKCPSRYPIIEACKRARKENIIIILATQFASSVHIDARRNCLNRFVGETIEFADRKIACELLGDKTIFDKLWGLNPGEFFVRGKALCSSVQFIQTRKPIIDTPEIGVKQEQTFSNGMYKIPSNETDGYHGGFL